MKNELKIISIVGVAAVLAGCEPLPIVDPGLTSYTEVNDAMAVMAADYVGVDPTPWADITAATGTATYNGFVGGDISGGTLTDNRLVGELTLEVDFEAGIDELSGTADNFYGDINGQYSGTLTVSGDIATEGHPIIGKLNGTLSNGGTDYLTSILIDGEFLGATSPDAVGGWAIGEVGDSWFEGDFVAE